MLGKDLPLKTTSIILGLFLWLVMSFSPIHLNTGLVSSRASLTSLGEGASLAVAGRSSSDGMTIKIPMGSMFFYIDQVGTPSFPIGLVKPGSGFIVRSVETGLGR